MVCPHYSIEGSVSIHTWLHLLFKVALVAEVLGAASARSHVPTQRVLVSMIQWIVLLLVT